MTNPTPSITDSDPSPTKYPLHVEENIFKNGIRVVSHEAASSGIAYADFGVDISVTPYEDMILLPSLISLLNEAGTSDMSAADFRYVLLDDFIPLPRPSPFPVLSQTIVVT